MASYTKTPLTPSAVNNYIKSLLEDDINIKKLYIAGEVSNVKYHSNGNIYFNIKDDNAQINCLMFKNYQQLMDTKLVEGDKIELLGNIYTYVKMGQYTINVTKIRKMGQGDLFAKYLQLKNELESKGYFSDSIKKEIPKFPQHIGVLTSDTGAAIKDIVSTIKRRYPIVKVTILPTLVQGKNAHHNIVQNIQFAQQLDFDVLIVGRGGGSIEDLWSFNELDVANAIYNSLVPIISAVGHETDFTIADFVADKRAPTPTGAAEMATPDINELKANIKKSYETLRINIKSKVDIAKGQLKIIEQNQYFTAPLLNIQNDMTFLSEKFLNQINNLNIQMKNYKEKIHNYNELNIESINKHLETSNIKIQHQKEMLDNLNPLNILSKGYATVQKENKFIKTITDLEIEDEVNISLTDGQIIANIKEIKEK